MSQPPNIDGVLIQWGDRLFYPGNRMVKSKPQPKLSGLAARHRAAAIRERIEATVVRRVPQVMVKVTGGGRGIKAIAAHLRYISKNGRLEIEDERGEKMTGKESLHELADDWRFSGSLIEEASDRREAFNIMLSMPRGTDPPSVHWAAREFARTELADHKYVMVLHDHQANPHVHISVRAESKHGKRLNPRKADLHRWRETFAEKLRDRGIEAEATRQAADAGLTNAKATEARIRSLNTSSYASQSQLDDAVAALATAQAQLANAAAAVTSANANVAVLQAQYAEAQAGSRALELTEEQAQRNLDRTEIRAPFDGVVANIAAKTGELVSPGTMLAAVVPAGSLYVEANFKETQLARIREGATAEIAFDVLPGVTVEGRVASIAPATGANFSLLPPENATGNFTKIVQRVPVRIDLPAGAVADDHLRAGLSVIVSVDSRMDDADTAAAPAAGGHACARIGAASACGCRLRSVAHGCAVWIAGGWRQAHTWCGLASK